MPSLTLQFSIQFEVDRCWSTINNLDWFSNNGYSVRLVNGFKPNIELPELRQLVELEYDSASYQKFVEYLKHEWKIVKLKFEQENHVLPFTIEGIPVVFLTKYGTAGSYDSLKGAITVNIANRTERDVLRVMIHELIHIGIAPLILKYGISHWKKERFVDLIEIQCFPDIACQQSIDPEAASVDAVFMTHYPALEKIASQIGKQY